MNKGKTILLTGASGFLGKHIIAALKENYAITTLGRTPVQGFSNIRADLGNAGFSGLPKVDIVIHAAGKAHVVPKTDKEKNDFFKVNVDGTRSLLQSLTRVKPTVFIFISSIAVYGKEEGLDIDENTTLTATDPYGLSKLQAEKLILAWGKEEDVVVGILRLPLLIGKKAPGNFGTMVNAIRKGHYLNIGKGEARKSMVLASDVANIIPDLALKGGIYNLTDGFHPSFKELSATIARTIGKSSVPAIPLPLARLLSSVGDFAQNKLHLKFPLNSYSFRKMTASLTFSDDKARRELNWNPTKVLEAIPEII